MSKPTITDITYVSKMPLSTENMTLGRGVTQPLVGYDQVKKMCGQSV